MTHHEVVRKIAGILAIIIILFVLFERFDLKDLLVSKTSSDVVIKNGNEEKTINEKTPLQVKFISMNTSFIQNEVTIEIQNVDKVPGEVTVELSCIYPDVKINRTYYLEPHEIKPFFFNKLKGRCEKHKIYPEIIKRQE